MIPKQQEMDAIVNEVYTAIQQKPHLQSTLFVLCGDHGMNDAGNHGGASAGETSPALLFISPKFEAWGVRQESPVEAFDDLQYYRTVEQADITPTLAGLLGLPIPLNSLGVFIPEFLDMFNSSKPLLLPAERDILQSWKEHQLTPSIGSQRLQILSRNARQLLNTVQATFPGAAFNQDATAASCAMGADSGIEGVQCAWSQVLQLSSGDITNDGSFSALESSLLRFSRIAQDVMSSTASNYNISRLCLGLMITGAAALLVFPTTYHEAARSRYAGVFLAFMIVGYGSVMFASSYVEEEQQFWYWICSGWMLYLHIRSESSRANSPKETNGFFLHGSKLATLGLAVAQRLLRRWNQTGQKFAAEPDIARTFFPAHPAVFWGLFMLTYADAGYHLLRSLPSASVLKLGGVVLTALAFMFKLRFVANDSPELLVGSFLSKTVEKWPESLSLVLQARLIFGGLVCCAVTVILAQYRPSARRGKWFSPSPTSFHSRQIENTDTANSLQYTPPRGPSCVLDDPISSHQHPSVPLVPYLCRDSVLHEPDGDRSDHHDINPPVHHLLRIWRLKCDLFSRSFKRLQRCRQL